VLALLEQSRQLLGQGEETACVALLLLALLGEGFAVAREALRFADGYDGLLVFFFLGRGDALGVFGDGLFDNVKIDLYPLSLDLIRGQ
jgi:hypothetical protein